MFSFALLLARFNSVTGGQFIEPFGLSSSLLHALIHSCDWWKNWWWWW